MLAGLRPASLARLRFPLAELTKPEVRELAAEAGLEVAGRAESQDLCFLAGQGKRAFLRRHAGLGERRGRDRRPPTARVLGAHRGHHDFTVGQRRGLGRRLARAALRARAPTPSANRVTVGPRSTSCGRRPGPHPRRPPAPRRRRGSTRSASATTRRSAPAGSRPAAERRGLTLALDEPADAVAPGQVACLMDGDLVVGHGTIV